MVASDHKKFHLEGYAGCPHCGSHRVTYGPARDEGTDGDLVSDGNCRDCGKRWRDRYHLAEVIEVGTEGAVSE